MASATAAAAAALANTYVPSRNEQPVLKLNVKCCKSEFDLGYKWHAAETPTAYDGAWRARA